MRALRILGHTIESEILKQSIDEEVLSTKVGLTLNQLKKLYCGRLLLSFEQLKTLADVIGIPLNNLLSLDDTQYEIAMAQKSLGEPLSTDNREYILDLIDCYLDLREAVMK